MTETQPPLEMPTTMIMGCHYTPMFSRRTRVRVLGLVDQSSDSWLRWYRTVHEPEAVREIAEAGYGLVELHFLYGYGLQAEKEDVELTRQFVGHAHELGLKVIGYFQFFSIQEELFFLENPWARECLQLDSRGAVRRYTYDRPALCFSHPRVRRYYRDGIELGLTHCDLDGIRLDNDYYRGCCCDTCRANFQDFLQTTYPLPVACRVFGLPTLEGVTFLPADENALPSNARDPLWSAMVRFRQEQRQEMMRELASHVRSLKPGAILGGNPAIARRLPECTRIHVYPPDLGETHDLVCAENERFPARVGDMLRHQVLAYKWGQSGGYKIFASHHNADPDTSRRRWPTDRAECARSLCEGLCFGGHVPTTTWGLRMDSPTGGMLYQRPHFLDALRPVVDFLAEHAELYRGAVCNARVGVYYNRETLIGDEATCAPARDAVVQILLQNQMPFRFVDRDTDTALEGVQVLIVPDVRLVSDAQMERLTALAQRGGVVLCGDACCYDEFFLPRDPSHIQALRDARGSRAIASLSVPIEDAFDHAPRLLDALAALIEPSVTVAGSAYLGVDTFVNAEGQRTVHLLNYDNTQPVDVTVRLRNVGGSIEVLAPAGFGAVEEPVTAVKDSWTTVSCRGLDTYMVLRYGGEAANEG